MTFIWLAAIWAIVPVGLLAFVAFIRRRTLMRVGSTKSIFKYLLVIFIDHATFATEGTGLTLLVGDLLTGWPLAAATFCGGAYALLLAHMALDVALFVQGGLRMQWQFVVFTSVLKDFARGRAWRLQATAIMLATLSIWLAGSWAFYELLTHRGVTPDWELIPAIVTAMTASALARRTLPVFFMYEWTNPSIVAQVKFCTTLAQHVLRREHRHLRNDVGVPIALLPQHEHSIPAGPAFPLLRACQGFEGTRHFEIKLGSNERPHVVCIFLESFRARDVGALGAKHKITPNFDALCAQGVLWERFYANGTYTAPALTAALYGLLPRFAGVSLQMHMPPIHLRGMPHLFIERGYRTAFFSDGPMDWENKREFFLRNGFHFFFGPPSILDKYPGALPNMWSFDDHYLFKFHADWLAAQDAQNMPTFSSILTVTNHHPFKAPPQAADPVVDVPEDSDYFRYLRTTHYTDTCLGEYMDLLRSKGLYDKTIFIITGDHGQQVTPEGKMDWSGQYNDGGVHVPLLIVAPGRMQGGKKIKELGSQVDLTPTLMDLFNMQSTHHACGTSLVRHCDTRQAITLHPWKPGLYTNRFGDFRYVHSLETGVAALYDLARDPVEQIDIASRYPVLFHQQQQQVEVLQQYLEELYMANKLAPAPLVPGPHLPRLPQNIESAPASLHDLQHMIRDITAQAKARASTTQAEILMVGLYGMCLAATWLTEPQRLRLAQLGTHRLHRTYLGEACNAERIELAETIRLLMGPPVGQALPVWLAVKAPIVLAALR